jgi:cytochrome c oxidase subunit IV
MKTAAAQLRNRWTESWPLIFCFLCLISLPVFFDIYRMVAFKTSPRDDYAPFLLLLVNRGGRWPGSPFGYRVLSVAPAIPLFWLLPLYKFSLLKGVDLTYLRATQALAALSFLATAGAATFAFKMVRTRPNRGVGEAWLAALFTIVLANFDGIEGIDPVGVLCVYALLFWLEQPRYFCPLFCLTPLINEKVIFVFIFLMAGRLGCVNGFYRSHRQQIAAVGGGFLLYVLMIKIVLLPGNEGQLELGRRLPLLIHGIADSISSLKGLVRNVAPALIMTLPCALIALRKRVGNGLLTAGDLAVPLGMILTGLTLTESSQLQVGRIASYAMPFAVMALVTLIADLDGRPQPALVVHTQPAALESGRGLAASRTGYAEIG